MTIIPENVILKQIFWDMTADNIVNEFRYVSDHDDELFVERMHGLGYNATTCYNIIEDIKDIEELDAY
tara:strand:- start:6349 stop:6552 length:204 start_codon:yes stop_codon:yes gene_type:complete